MKAYAGDTRVGTGRARFEGGLLGSVRVKLNARGTKSCVASAASC